MKKAIKRIAMLFMVCGLAVSVSFAYELDSIQKSGVEYVKAVVAELERVDKQDKQQGGYSYHIGTDGERTLLAGKDFLEFVEKVKQNPEKDCDRAVRSVMSDSSNYDKYHYYVWSEAFSPAGCINLRLFVYDVKEIKKRLDRTGIKHNLP